MTRLMPQQKFEQVTMNVALLWILIGLSAYVFTWLGLGATALSKWWTEWRAWFEQAPPQELRATAVDHCVFLITMAVILAIILSPLFYVAWQESKERKNAERQHWREQ